MRPGGPTRPPPWPKVVLCNQRVTACEEAIAECRPLLAAAQKGFEAYKPAEIDEAGNNVGPHTKMMAVVGDFVTMVQESTDAAGQAIPPVKTQKELVASWPQA